MLYEVTLQQLYFNQVCINRWNYVSSGTPASVQGSFGLISAMGFIPDGTPPVVLAGSIFQQLRLMQNTGVQYTQVICKAIYDPVDFFTTALPTGFNTGTNVGENESPVIAFGFVSGRTRTDVSRATKRLPGLASEAINAGGLINAATLGIMQTLATRMAQVLTYDDEGNTISFTPTVVRKQKYTTPRGNQAYRYFPSLALQSQNWMQGFNWSPQNTVRTQTSRQYARGQ